MERDPVAFGVRSGHSASRAYNLDYEMRTRQ
jgi:hypothetical protein